ncbi:MAG: NAD(P)-binding domain-containing protein [Oscillospiraceae bacterium]|nr:NAD(P)-binding domain-containing protein [Oscillospiraceae bacterium]
MNIGIIGCGSMGKMLLEKFSASGMTDAAHLFAANRSPQKLQAVSGLCTVCGSNREAAEHADILFLCVRPADMKTVLTEIQQSVKETALTVSLNGSIPFRLLEQSLPGRRLAKAIPGVTAEINRSQTLVCYNDRVKAADRAALERLLSAIGSVTVLPEAEMGMGSELVSCMPGFIAAVFDVLCRAAKQHTALSDAQIADMVKETLAATGALMCQQKLSFADVLDRVATKGGITAEGADVIYRMLPETADELFRRTLEKRRITAEHAERSFR